MNESRPELLGNLIIISHKHCAEQTKSWAKRLLINKYFEEINELVLKRMNIEGITNETFFLEISTLNIDYYKEKYWQTAAHFVLKIS